MKAADARQLKVGDFIKGNFGNVSKSCEIIAIDWPCFTLRTKDHRGEEMIRKRNYQSIWGKHDPMRPTARGLPSWLKYDRPEGEP